MLILTRRINETVCIGDNIRVTVTSVHGAQVQLGIEAPREVPIHRQELYDRIQAEKRQEMKDDAREPAERPVSIQTGFDD